MLLRDIADVKRLREEDGPNLVTKGSTELVHALLANDLVDAMSTFTVPVVLGGGKKLFADGSAPHSYKLTRSRVSSTGLMIAHYRRGGEGSWMKSGPASRSLMRAEVPVTNVGPWPTSLGCIGGLIRPAAPVLPCAGT